MTLRTSLLPLAAAALAIGLGGCFVSVDDDGHGHAHLATYEPCSFDDDCLHTDICEPITVTSDAGRTVTDSMCTHGCFDDLDCPAGVTTGYRGACVDFGSGALCYERCDFDSDCPLGFLCYDCANGWCGDPICLPG